MLEVKKAVFPSFKQFDVVFKGMRNPYDSWNKSDSGICYGSDKELCKYCHGEEELNTRGCDYDPPIPIYVLGEKDLKLAKNLVNSGVEHAKFLRQLPVIFDLKMPLFMHKQLDQYKVSTVTDSCSTMHCLTKKPFELSDFCVQEDDEDFSPNVFLAETINRLNAWRDIYLETKDKRYWNAINEMLPQSYYQLRTWSANYAVLFNICAQRAGHPLNGWDEFICWIVDCVPYFRELCFDRLCKISKPFKELFKNE